MSYSTILSDIEKLPHYREFICKRCGHKKTIFILRIYEDCEQCGLRHKIRGYAALGSEIEDVVDAVLGWLGDESDLEEAMEWKKILDSHNKLPEDDDLS